MTRTCEVAPFERGESAREDKSILYTRPLGRLHLLLLLSLLAAVAGCRRGSHLAEAQVAEAQAPVFENFAVEVELDTVSVQFEVSDPQERDWQAWIYFSDNLGTQWQQITPVREGENQIPLSPPFESASSEWSYRDDLTSLPQADILVEVRLLDQLESNRRANRAKPSPSETRIRHW